MKYTVYSNKSKIAALIIADTSCVRKVTNDADNYSHFEITFAAYQSEVRALSIKQTRETGLYIDESNNHTIYGQCRV